MVVACRECGQAVSTEAASCPHCGIGGPVAATTGLVGTTPVRSAARHRPWGIAVAVVVVLLIGGPVMLRAMGRSALTGGKTDGVVQVVAPSGDCWAGSIGSATQEGCGDAEFPVHDPLGVFSSNVQKHDGGAWTVTINVVIDGQVVASNSTSAAYGVAMVVVGR